MSMKSRAKSERLSQNMTAPESKHTEVGPPRELVEQKWIRAGHRVNSLLLLPEGFLIAGTEAGLRCYDFEGDLRWEYVPESVAAVVALALSVETGEIYFATRGSRLGVATTDVPGEVFDVSYFPITVEKVHTLAFSPPHKLLAVGHLHHAITVLDVSNAKEATVRWRKHPDDGTATQGSRWCVDVDPDYEMLYVGSGGEGRNVIAAVNLTRAGFGSLFVTETGVHVTSLCALPGNRGCVAVVQGEHRSDLICFKPEAGVVATYSCLGPVTALAVDLMRQDAFTVVAADGDDGLLRLLWYREDGQLQEVVNHSVRFRVYALAYLATRNVLAVALEDGTVGLLSVIREVMEL